MGKGGEKWGKLSDMVGIRSMLDIPDLPLYRGGSSTYFFLILAMFIGEYQHSIDDKGRLAVPVKFRGALSKGAVVTRGLDSCLWLYSLKNWKQLAAKISKLPLSQANSRAFSRLMLAGAMDVKLDRQGRIILPDYLQSYSGLSKKVMVTGVYDRLEIWDENKWRTYKTNTEKDSNDIAETLGSLGV